jgi:hypothetical protein
MSLKFLKQLGKLKNIIVMTYQVEMEFKKNRQSVILETIRNLKNPPPVSHPVIFSDDTTCESLKEAFEKMQNGLEHFKLKLQKILQEPTVHDHVYNAIQNIFSKNDELTMRETSPETEHIIQRAQKRFILGYPPRKRNDNSVGDAVNWEWLVHLASQREAMIYLVSRDVDFGVELDRKYHLNDLLKDEFHKRTDGKSNIHFTGKLCEALEKLSVSISKTQEKAEDALITRLRSARIAEKDGRYIEYLEQLNEEELQNEIDSKIGDTHRQLIDDETVCGRMAETNACDWLIDEYEMLDIQIEDDLARARISFCASGEQDDSNDKPFCGDKISGVAEARIDEFGQVIYTVENAEVDWGRYRE